MTNRLLEQTLRPMPVPDLMRERIEAQVREGEIALHHAGLVDIYGRWVSERQFKQDKTRCASTSP